MRVTNRLRFPLACLLVTGLMAGLAIACDGEEEEAATATPIEATHTPTVVAVPPQPEPSVDIREVNFYEVLGTTGCCAEFAQYADLTGDGQEEAILPLFPADTGPIGGFDGLWVYGYVDGELQALLAVETAIWGAEVEDSRLVVVYPVYGPDDLMGEPSQLNNTYYEWDGSELVLVGEETIDNPYLEP